MSQNTPVFCPNCGTPFVQRDVAGRTRPICPECGFVHYHNPIPGVGVLIEMDGGVVLIKRGHPPHAERWTLPSGFMEADESVEEATVREAKEETNLDIALQEMVGVFSFPDGPPTSGIIVFYRAKPVGGTLRAGDDAIDARVFALDELPDLPFRTHRQALEQWLAQVKLRHAERQRIERDGFHIREAIAADAPRVLELAGLIPGKVKLGVDFQRAARQRLLESTSLGVFVAETTPPDSQIIGFTALSRVTALTRTLGWIDAMTVDPNFRRMGVGAALMEAVLRRAARLNLSELFVNTEQASEVALAFYRSTGFQEGQITRLRLR